MKKYINHWRILSKREWINFYKEWDPFCNTKTAKIVVNKLIVSGILSLYK